MVRLSFGAYTTTADVDRALDAIALLATTSGRAAATATYAQSPDGTWAPRRG
jgi:cysteine sulfinate desulfinase/cysteine desulfurase-like protein